MPIITENNYTFTSADGATPIHVREWVPDCDINGVVQIAHGINEYIGRYEHFARYLASKGFVVVGNDHLGHGESVLGPEYLGFFALDEGWYKVVADMEQLRELTAAKWPEAPYFLFGHSMGSFLTRTYLIRYPGAPLAGVILSGTGQAPEPVVAAGRFLCDGDMLKNGPMHRSEAISNVAFGSYNKAFEPKRTKYDWLIWNLTGGREHISDYSNCSRTMLFDIDRLRWDEDLCRVLGVPMSMLPAPVPNSAEYGRIAPGIKGIEALAGVPICGSAGDQAAALLGQGCIVPGEAKNTYGTGCFTLMNTGERSVRSLSGMLTSVAWSLGGRTTYALEGSVFNAGSSIQWLRDEVGLIATAAESGPIAASVPDNGGVYLVSAFTGLGAPHWDMYARGTMVGLTRGTTRAHIVRAAMEGIAYQVKDLLDAMELDSGRTLSVLRVDGGASVSDFLMQFQADILRKPIDRPRMVETTAFGAAFLAGLAAGLWSKVEEIAALRQSEQVFEPQMDERAAEKYHGEWLRAVERAKKWETSK